MRVDRAAMVLGRLTRDKKRRAVVADAIEELGERAHLALTPNQRLPRLHARASPTAATLIGVIAPASSPVQALYARRSRHGNWAQYSASAAASSNP